MKRKIGKWQKVVCGAAACAVLAVGGFMGVDKFMPKERSLTIVDDMAVTAGGTAATETAADTAAETSRLKINAKAAVLIDGSSGKVLFAQNEKKHLPPASVTKVMTLLLVLEAYDAGKIALEDEVVISENAASMGGSQMYMEPGETHTVEELLKGVIMASANDGCVALEKGRVWERNEIS